MLSSISLVSYLFELFPVLIFISVVMTMIWFVVKLKQPDSTNEGA